MVFTNKYTETLIDRFPNFAKSESLRGAIELYSEDHSVSIHTVFTGLTNYVVSDLIKKNIEITKEEVAIYGYIEEILIKYNSFPEKTDERDLDNAACTCFLENLINIASAGKIEYSRFIPYLGEKSKEFCRGWDEFTGIKSPGLWD